jgi:hypothetical protein
MERVLAPEKIRVVLEFKTLSSRIGNSLVNGCSSYLPGMGIWQTLMRRKYVVQNVLSHVSWKPGDFHFSSRIKATKKFLFSYWSFSIKYGSKIRF